MVAAVGIDITFRAVSRTNPIGIVTPDFYRRPAKSKLYPELYPKGLKQKNRLSAVDVNR